MPLTKSVHRERVAEKEAATRADIAEREDMLAGTTDAGNSRNLEDSLDYRYYKRVRIYAVSFYYKTAMLPEENQQPKPADTQAADQNTQNENPALPRLRTMKYDASHYLKEKNISFLDLVAKEQQKHEEEVFEFRDRMTDQIWFKVILTLIVLIVLGIGGYAAFTYFVAQPVTLQPGEAAPKNYLAVERRDVVSTREGDRAGLFEKLRASRKDRLPSGSIKQVIIKLENLSGTAHYATIKEFFGTLDFRPPNDLAANLENNFNFLIYYTPQGASAGMILEPKNPERAFAQMVAWERSIILDWRYFYFDQTITSTSKVFTDDVIKNIDMRILNITEGTDLMYGFFAGKYLLISTSREFMELMISRLLTSPPVK